MVQFSAVVKNHKNFVKYIKNGYDKVSAYQKTYPDACLKTAQTRSKALLEVPYVKQSLESVLEGAGITTGRIASKYSILLDAKKPLSTRDGVVMVEDNSTQLNTANKCAEMLQMLQPPSLNIDNRSVTIELDGTTVQHMQAMTERLTTMSADMLDDVQDGLVRPVDDSLTD